MSIEILDPTHEGDARAFAMSQRLASLQGKTIGVISNGKQGTGRFFDSLEQSLTAQGAASIVRLTKANYSAPAEAGIVEQAAQCDAVIAGIGD